MTSQPGPLLDQSAQTASSRLGPKRLYQDAMSLATSSLVNAGLGVGFWAVAAKVCPPERLGVMTAVLSVIMAMGLAVASGVGDAYTALLPAVGAARPMVYRRGLRVTVALSLSCGLVAAALTLVLIHPVHGSLPVGGLIVFGVLVWSLFVLLNSTLTALGRARWLPAVNAVSGIGKIVMLPVLAGLVPWHNVELATLLPAAMIVCVLYPITGRIARTGPGLPSDSAVPAGTALREFNRLAPRTILSVALSLGLLTAAPFLVTAFSNAREGALFALSFSVVQVLDFIGSSMSGSLVVHGAGSPLHTDTMSRAILLRASGLTVLGAVIITAFAPLALGVLNPVYKTLDPNLVIGLLCAGCVVRTPYMVWGAVQRARRAMRPVLVMNFLSAAIFVGLAPLLVHGSGAAGGALALLIGQIVLSAGAGVHVLMYRNHIHRSEAT